MGKVITKRLKEVLLEITLHIRMAAEMQHEAEQELDIAAEKLKRYYLEINNEVGNGSKKEGEKDP